MLICVQSHRRRPDLVLDFRLCVLSIRAASREHLPRGRLLGTGNAVPINAVTVSAGVMDIVAVGRVPTDLILKLNPEQSTPRFPPTMDRRAGTGRLQGQGC